MGFHQICENRWIFLCDLVGLTVKEKCDIIELKETIFRPSLGIIVWKGFPYKDVLTKL